MQGWIQDFLERGGFSENLVTFVDLFLQADHIDFPSAPRML